MTFKKRGRGYTEKSRRGRDIASNQMPDTVTHKQKVYHRHGGIYWNFFQEREC